MAISEAARQNHESLFPGEISTLAVTDPELIKYFTPTDEHEGRP